jgi:hypothetical protein
MRPSIKANVFVGSNSHERGDGERMLTGRIPRATLQMLDVTARGGDTGIETICFGQEVAIRELTFRPNVKNAEQGCHLWRRGRRKKGGFGKEMT